MNPLILPSMGDMKGLKQKYADKDCLIFDQTCLNEKMLPKYTHTHTHTHTYIYIYIYIC